MTEPWDVAVVGAGIAGLTAARTCAERGLRTVAYDLLAPGGRLISLGALTAYPSPTGAVPSGPEFAGALLEDAMAAGVEISYGEVTGLAAGPELLLDTAEGPAEARAVVVATGRAPGRLPGVPDAEGWVGRGLSECASCDGPLHAGRDVVVVGGDEWAAHEAAELAGVAARVTVVVPGVPTWSPTIGARLADLPGVDVRAGVDVAGLSGASTLDAVVLDDGTEVAASGVFVYTAMAPRSALLEAARGDHRVVAAGDVALTPGTTPYLLAAAADGLRAGLAVAGRVTVPSS